MTNQVQNALFSYYKAKIELLSGFGKKYATETAEYLTEVLEEDAKRYCAGDHEAMVEYISGETRIVKLSIEERKKDGYGIAA